jgi:hypothetical protein
VLSNFLLALTINCQWGVQTKREEGGIFLDKEEREMRRKLCSCADVMWFVY